MTQPRLPSSFRDPSGYVFTRKGETFRHVSRKYKEQYDCLIDSGLYDALIQLGLLVRHEEVDLDDNAATDAYKILKPELIPFMSYPYEWSFSQLKDAALTTLAIQRNSLAFGMTLKDCSAYNIQFFHGRPILIDTLSFEKYQEGEPWVAYQQFCRHFLAPLALMRYSHVGMGQLSRIHIDGIPLDLAHSLLPMRTRLKPSLQIHIHLHSRFQQKYADRIDAKTNRKKSLRLRGLLGLIDSLESAIKKLRWRQDATEWGDYDEDDSYTPDALQDKMEVIRQFLLEANPKTVWDMGANTGMFSRLASDMGVRTIAFDKDPSAVERNYHTLVSRKETHLLPLLVDLTNPSPRIGWANRERMDLLERGPTDMLFALALIHHLAISENVPLGMIAEFFRKLCTWTVIEFVPKSDKKVERLLATRDDIFADYTQQNFEDEFETFFEILSVRKIVDSERTLYLMHGK